MKPRKPSRFDAPDLVAEAVCNVLIRYASLMGRIAGQDAVDGLELVRQVIMTPAREHGLAGNDLEALDQLLNKCRELAVRAMREARLH